MVVHVPQELIDEIQKYNQELKKYEDQPKWQWPSQIVKKLHNVSEQIRPALTKDLYNLMARPNSDSADPKGFYREGKDTLPGHRPVTGWYESQGYKKHTTTYTYAAGPDKRELTAAFYIPINLKSNTEVPFMWFFHGGGFVSNQDISIVNPWLTCTVHRCKRPRGLALASQPQTSPQKEHHHHRP